MARKKQIIAPTYTELIPFVYKSLRNLGGSGTNEEILNSVISLMNLSDEAVDEQHKGAASQRTELEYQIAWARTYLKKYGAITNSVRGVWVICSNFSDIEAVDSATVVKTVTEAKESVSDENTDITDGNPENDGVEAPEELEPWRTELSEVLLNMNPYSFEKLAQLLLRECGFTQVIVTKKSGDGGIDGTGKLRINGIFSFNVAFQCKRYKGSVTAGDIRDFRGSLTTDIEKGVFITTGTFTKAAKEEASNAGKQQIDLIDGEEFINKLIEYGIGVQEKKVYIVDRSFFNDI